MKTTIALGLILAAGLAQAAPRINISAKTGQRLTDSDDFICNAIDPVRSATSTVSVSQYIYETDPQDGSMSFESKIICDDLKGTVDVYVMPQDSDCFSIKAPSSVTCAFKDSAGLPAKAKIAGTIFIKGDEKSFNGDMSTAQLLKHDFAYNKATVFDPKIQKLLLTVSNDRLGSDDGKTVEKLAASVLFEDANP